MKIVLRVSGCLALLMSLCWGQPFGLSNRVANTTLAMPANPATFGFTSVNAFPSLLFTNPVAIVSPPSETNRLFIVERIGRIVVITNLANPTRTIFLNIAPQVATSAILGEERGLLGLAFHPGYATNRLFFVFYTTTGTLRDRLSRFETSPTNPNQAMGSPELVLIDQVDEAGNHNGGDLHFGPDGYLYVSLGDEGDANDSLQNSQRINKDFFSGILRIDVDKRGSLMPNTHPASTTNYTIPTDNPFIGATNFNGLTVNSNSVRTEFWAVGLRNPWRFGFDHDTGLLYCGDVGQGAREEIDIIVRGGNYGWNYREGFIQRPNSGTPPAAFTHINPLVDYPRSLGFAVTGGVVYRGARLAQLYGAYVYADYGSGRVWALRHQGTNVTQNQLFLTDTGITAFGIDPRNGDVLYADFQSGNNATIDRLDYTGAPTGPPLPATLADTGSFSDLATLTPHPGIVPYDLNVPFWSDNARKTRWFSVPNTNLTIGFVRESNWSFPTGTVWIKHFELELTNGVPESARRLETRFIVRNTNGIYGATYRWGSSLTNATLAPEEGLDETFVVNDGGLIRTQVWHYPSRAECLACHTFAGGLALGFNTPQLNRDFDYGGIIDNQIRALNHAGYFNTNVTGLHTLRALAHATNHSYSLEYRARSYLAANCAQCHQPSGSALGSWDARIFTPLSAANLVNGPLINSGGNAANRVIKPGSVSESMLLSRLSTLDSGRMPPLDTTVLDTEAIGLVSAWITNDLAGYQSFADWQIAHFGSTNAANAGPNADPDMDGGKNYLEWLTGTNPLLTSDVWSIGFERSGDVAEIIFPRIANRGFEVQCTTDLVNTSSWQILDVPENRPLFSATNAEARVPDSITNAPAKYYRVRVYEP